MEKKKLGNTEIYVTPVGLGVLTIGKSQLNLPLSEGAELISYALEKGINFLDTAEYYDTYDYIAAALKSSSLEPVIVSKSLTYHYDAMKDAVEEYRTKLNRDIVDIFLLHEVKSKDDFKARSGAWECLNDLKAKGIIKAIGISTHHTNIADFNSELPESDVLFPLINFDSLGIRYKNQPGTKEAMVAAIDKNVANGKGVFAMKVFGGGNLTDNYINALDYVNGIKGITSMMIGMGKKSEVDNIIDYFEGRLPADFEPDIGDKKIHIELGDCEGCGLCESRCPNSAISTDSGIAIIDYDICLNCGYCAPVCPVRAIIMY